MPTDEYITLMLELSEEHPSRAVCLMPMADGMSRWKMTRGQQGHDLWEIRGWEGGQDGVPLHQARGCAGCICGREHAGEIRVVSCSTHARCLGRGNIDGPWCGGFGTVCRGPAWIADGGAVGICIAAGAKADYCMGARRLFPRLCRTRKQEDDGANEPTLRPRGLRCNGMQ